MLSGYKENLGLHFHVVICLSRLEGGQCRHRGGLAAQLTSCSGHTALWGTGSVMQFTVTHFISM